MKRHIIPILAVAMILSASVVNAQGWYAGAFGSYSSADDIGFGTALGTVKTTFDRGTGLGLFVGYDFDGIRIEGDWSWREFSVEDHILGGAKLPGPTGEADSTSYMLNAFYDFNRDGTVQPYVGVGVGFTDVEVEKFGVAPVPEVLNDQDSAFSYQIMAGLGFEISKTVALFVDYRFQSTSDLTVTVTPGAGGVSTDIDWDVQDVAGGVRFSF